MKVLLERVFLLHYQLYYKTPKLASHHAHCWYQIFLIVSDQHARRNYSVVRSTLYYSYVPRDYDREFEFRLVTESIYFVAATVGDKQHDGLASKKAVVVRKWRCMKKP